MFGYDFFSMSDWHKEVYVIPDASNAKLRSVIGRKSWIDMDEKKIKFMWSGRLMTVESIESSHIFLIFSSLLSIQVIQLIIPDSLDP